MVIGDLVEYLHEHLSLGYDIDTLKLHLAKFGHSPKMINEAVDIVKREALDALPCPTLPNHLPSNAHVWLLMPAVLFMLVFSIMIVVALLRNPLV